MIPKDPEKRLAVITLAAAADGLMDVTVSVFMEKVRHPKDFNEASIAALEVAIKRCLAYFEAWPAPDCPRLARWYEEFSKRPSMRETMPKEK